MELKLENKVVLLTGGSSGIGTAIAIESAKHGAHVAITYKTNSTGAKETVIKLQKLGAEALAIKADLRNEGEAKKVLAETIKRFGQVDCLVNNVGIYINGDEWDGTSKTWEASIGQNLITAMNTTKYAIKHFQKRKAGSIVNISSRLGNSGNYEELSYGAAKAGIINITQAYAKLLLPFGRANSVSPGSVNTGYWKTAPKSELMKMKKSFPQHRLIEPEEIAKVVVFLLSDDAQSITGQNILVDGGRTLV